MRVPSSVRCDSVLSGSRDPLLLSNSFCLRSTVVSDKGFAEGEQIFLLSNLRKQNLQANNERTIVYFVRSVDSQAMQQRALCAVRRARSPAAINAAALRAGPVFSHCASQIQLCAVLSAVCVCG